MSLLKRENALAERQPSGIGTMKQPSKQVALVAQVGADSAPTVALLNELGWQHSVASTWHEAEKQLGQTHFDVMITDYDLAGGDGFDLIVNWRSQEICLRVLFLAVVPIQSCVPVERLGLCGVLIKPFTKSELKKALDGLLRLKGEVEPDTE
jgi:DNA-binding response OmpR family regulator